LGIKAANPEITDTNQLINLELIVTDVNGGGRTVTGEVVSCLDPGVGYGAEVSCDHNPTVHPDLTIDFNVDIGSTSSYTGDISYPAITYPGNLITFRSDRDKFNGVAYLIIFTFNVDGNIHKAFKRIIVTTRSPNNNPSISRLSVNGSLGDISALPQDGDSLALISDSPETYTYRTVEDIDETRTEELQVAWYLSEGELSRSKTYMGEETEYEKNETTTNDSVVVAIVRDDRGGLDFKVYSP
jgi:hypothetical protein